MGERSGEAAAWVAAWRDAVERCTSPLGLSYLDSLGLVGLSESAATLLGTTSQAARGLKYQDLVVNPDDAENVAQLFRTGGLDGVVAQRQFRRDDGKIVDAQVWAQAVRWSRLPTMGLGLFGIGDLPATPSEAGEAAADARSAAPAVRIADGDTTMIVDIVDNRWVVREEGVADRRLTDVARGEQLVPMLFALARASTHGVATERIIVTHHDGSTRGATVVIRARDALIEAQFDMRFIARGVSAPLARTNLSDRQRDIVTRLSRGDRVEMIADALYLSRSTVRNHLVAVFRKTGVHSQAELLRLLREQRAESQPASM
jgi:DNA-binding NarL/FixJ family response regulator